MQSFTRRFAVLALVVAPVLAPVLAPVFANAQDTPAPGITVEQPWMRAAVQGGTGGAFLTLRNTGNAPDRLLSVSSAAARAAELHTTQRDGDVMRMVPVASVEVPAGGSVAFRPGGMHVMLVGLAAAARPGTTVPLTLNFERAGPVALQVPVGPAGASGPQEPGHHH